MLSLITRLFHFLHRHDMNALGSMLTKKLQIARNNQMARKEATRAYNV